MAYTDDSVKARLSALNETQDSIVTVAQWILFHRRHADRTAQLWLDRLKESNSSKRLNLIYLANEVVQQSKARKKEDFMLAFAPIIAEATSVAYKGSTQEVQQKIRRVVEVWRQRAIFDNAIQQATETRLDEIDKNRGNRSSGPRLGGSLFGNTSSPPELQPVVQSQTNLTRAETTARGIINTANTEYAKLTDPAAQIPTPPVHAARLSSLLKNLASAEGAVNDSIKARKELIAGLEKLLETNRSKLAEEETTSQDFASRKSSIETKKKEVEDSIMRGLSHESTPTATNYSTMGEPANGDGSGSPEMEGFTPPPPEVETFTPPPADRDNEAGQDFLESNTFAADPVLPQPPTHDEPAPSFEPPAALQSGTQNVTPDLAFLASLNLPQVRPASSTPPTNGASSDPRLKRRKMSHKSADMDDEIFGSGNGIEIDDDVAAMLGAQ